MKLFNLRFFIFINKFYNNKNFPKKINKEFYQILNETKNLVSKNGSKFYFIYLPEYNRYLDENYSNELYFNIKNIVKSLGIDFIDIKEEIFNKENIDTFWSERGMFKIKTNEMIAQEIINTTNTSNEL